MKKSVTVKAAWIMASATVIAALIGGISLIYLKNLPQNKIKGDYVAGNKTINIIISDPVKEEKVRQTANKQQSDLTTKYPGGTAILGVTPKGFIVPKGLVPPNSEIKWDTAKIIELSEHTVKIFVPHMTINTETNKGLRIIGQEVVLPKKVGAKWSMIGLPTLRIQVEIIGIYEQIVVVAIGFAPK